MEHGEVILTDQEFGIADSLGVNGACLEIPSFMRRKQQLTMQKVKYSKTLSKVSTHIEQVESLIKNKYTVLQSTLPINLTKHRWESDYANVDKILTVCVAFINVCPSGFPL